MHEYGVHRSGGAGGCIGGIRNKRLTHLLWARRRTPGEAHRDGHHMSVDNRHPITRRRHAQRLTCPHVERFQAIVPIDEVPENLERLPLHLFFFAANVGYDVVDDVEAGYAGVACARDGLHGGDDAGFDRAKGFFERAEGYHETGRGAVGVGEDEAFFEGWIMERALLRDHGEMGGVDEGDDEWDMGIASIVFGV